jgi:lipopolysaccharide biosynthesis protein
MAKLIAFYLPQYHPIPENDAWWGKGFTEWSNVAKARPWFEGHIQPHLPADLGYYDLRLDEVRDEQARLASSYGIHGFCYYYYWFNGRRLLERPLDAMLKTGKPDFPFCICWANETWSRRWDGSEHEVLMEQVHTPDSDKRFIEDVIPLLADRRYIRIDGAPLLLVYRISLLPDPVAATETWRRACFDAGIGKIHIAAVRSFGIEDPRIFGCDSAVEFPPHGVSAAEITDKVDGLDPKFEGKIYDYRDLIVSDEFRVKPPYPVFPGVMPSWDNTARRNSKGHVFHHASPHAYEVWLRNALTRAAKEPVLGEQVVFINAWNEWAEGTHLEPDKQWGHEYLQATRRAIREASTWMSAATSLKAVCGEHGVDVSAQVDMLIHRIEALEAANGYLKRLVDVNGLKKHLEAHELSPRLPEELISERPLQPGLIHIEQVNNSPPNADVRIQSGGHFFVKGWAFMPAVAKLDSGRQTFFVFFDVLNGDAYRCMFSDWELRADVSEAFSQYPTLITADSGFSCMIGASQLPVGRYRMAVIERGKNKNGIAFANTVFEVR